jgi:hypothetical protein
VIAQQEAQTKAKYLRVKVVDNTKENRPEVNVRVPIGLVKFGFKMARAFSPEMKNANIDWNEVAAMIDEGAMGELVHVEDEAEHKTIDVYVE